jgi:hypothetical protein
MDICEHMPDNPDVDECTFCNHKSTDNKPMDNTNKTKLVMFGAFGLTLLAIVYQGLVGLPQARMEQEAAERTAELEKERGQEMMLSACLRNAETSYWDWVKLNMTEQEDGSYRGATSLWNQAEEKKLTDEDACYRQYN